MLCERCKKNEATIHLTEIIKDVRSEVHICEECAGKIGLNSKLSEYTLSVSDMLTFLEVSELQDTETVSGDGTCLMCGMNFYEYKKEGRLGCPDCYRYMEDSIEAVVKGYHGQKCHVGKIPSHYNDNYDEELPVREKSEENLSVSALKLELEKAVEDERYEDAAIIRDRIKDLIL